MRCRESVVGLLVLIGAAAAHGRDAPSPILVSEFPCPDPFVFRDGTDWYIFGTGAKPFFLQGRTFGEGMMKRVFLDLDYEGFRAPVAHVWGFIVYRHKDGTFHAYGTLHLGNFRTVIAHFLPHESEKWQDGQPIVKWKFNRLLVGDPSRQEWGSYESKILVDKDGVIFLMFVTRSGRDNHIVAQRMNAPDEIDASAPRHVLLKPQGYRSEDRDGPDGMQLVEGGSIHACDGGYILLYSVGNYARGNYKLGMAFSESLIPPRGQTYRVAKRPDPDRIWGASGHADEVVYLLQSEKREWPNYIGADVVGPGLGSLVADGPTLWLFFHGYRPDDEQRRPANRHVYRLPVELSRSPDGPIPHIDLSQRH